MSAGDRTAQPPDMLQVTQVTYGLPGQRPMAVAEHRDDEGAGHWRLSVDLPGPTALNIRSLPRSATTDDVKGAVRAAGMAVEAYRSVRRNAENRAYEAVKNAVRQAGQPALDLEG